MGYEVSSDIFQRLERIKGSLLLSLKEDLYKLAVEYSYIRGQWKFLSVEERMELEIASEDLISNSYSEMLLDR